MSKQTRWIVGAISAILAATVLGISGCSTNENNASDAENTDGQSETDSESSADSGPSPMVEDFDTSMIGYRFDEWPNGEIGGNYLLVLLREPDALEVSAGDTMELDWTMSSEGAIFPNQTTAPRTVEIDDSDAQVLRDTFEGFPEHLTFEDGQGATMYVVVEPSSAQLDGVSNSDDYSYTYDAGYIFAGIDLGSKTELEPGFPLNADSYPTDWLRKEPYATELLEINSIDIEDPFWDDWEYQEQIPVEKVDTSAEGPEETIVEVRNVESFTVIEPFAWNNQSLEEINSHLENMGYEPLPER